MTHNHFPVCFSLYDADDEQNREGGMKQANK
jgi:hypothetical protein